MRCVMGDGPGTVFFMVALCDAAGDPQIISNINFGGK